MLLAFSGRANNVGAVKACAGLHAVAISSFNMRTFKQYTETHKSQIKALHQSEAVCEYTSKLD